MSGRVESLTELSVQLQIDGRQALLKLSDRADTDQRRFAVQQP
jgi:hypothetical protein